MPSSLQPKVIEDQRLIKRHHALPGPPNLCGSYIRLAGTAPIAEALLSGGLQFTRGYGSGALLLPDRTRAMVKATFAMNAIKQLLTLDPAVKAIGAPTPQDRIAPPAAKVGAHANTLPMAAVHEVG